jgi:D-amino peptidase
MLHPAEACDRIERAVPEAIAARAEVAPVRFEGPVEVEVDLLRPGMTERALLVPGIERAGPRTLRYPAPDFPTAYQVIELIDVLSAG